MPCTTITIPASDDGQDNEDGSQGGFLSENAVPIALAAGALGFVASRSRE